MKKKKKSFLWKISLGIFIVYFMSAITLVFGVIFLSPKLDRLNILKGDKDLGINKIQNEKNEHLNSVKQARNDVINILLIGLDGEDYKFGRSDVMLMASINKSTKKIYLTSFMRDTMAYLPTSKTYEKLNHSYAYGGSEEVLKAINTNYDLNIRNVVVFNYKAMGIMVESIGGVVVDIDEKEMAEMNRFIVTSPIKKPGRTKLNGYQALVYARIRKGGTGGDSQRNHRQREIIKYIFEYAKKANMQKLFNIANKVLPSVKTSFSYEEIVGLLNYFESIRGRSQIKEFSFPKDRQTVLVDGLYYEVAKTNESNIIELHKELFNLENYHLSDTAKKISDYIKEKTGLK